MNVFRISIRPIAVVETINVFRFHRRKERQIHGYYYSEVLMQTLISDRTDYMTEYNSFLNGAILRKRAENGLLVVTDGDRVDFLQRMTTNDIQALKPGASTVTVLTNPMARILFVFTVLCRDDDLLLLPATGQHATLEKYLRGQIFFIDQVKIDNRSDKIQRYRLIGLDSANLLAEIGYSVYNLADEAVFEKNNLLILKQQAYDLPGFEVIVPSEQAPDFAVSLNKAGVLTLTDEDAYLARRIELGRPSPGYELTDAFTPLEAGLAWTCAENKGCYTGQKIIARQITYDKVTKRLVGLRSDSLLTSGAVVIVDGRNVGTVTSAVHSPTLDAPIALAIVKRPHNEPGRIVEVDGNSVEVVTIPFV